MELCGVEVGTLSAATGGCGALDPADTCFLLCATPPGAALVAAVQYTLAAAVDVQAADPFPAEPADWPALLDGATPDAFLAPRHVFFLSYFLAPDEKRWWARVRHCRGLAYTLRALRALYLDADDSLPPPPADFPVEAWRCFFGEAAPAEVAAHAGAAPLRRLAAASARGDDGVRHAAYTCLAAMDPRAPQTTTAALQAFMQGAPPLPRAELPPYPAAGMAGGPLRALVPETLERLATVRTALAATGLEADPGPARRAAAPLDDAVARATWQDAARRFLRACGESA